jgi:uncharacterized protein
VTHPALLRRRAVALVAVVLALGAFAWGIGSRLIEPDYHAVALPEGFAAKSVSIPDDGHTIAGWWVDSGGDSPVVLLVHGVRADRTSMVSRAQMLLRNGFGVLLIDLQAHGETPGDAITLGYRESGDVVAARDWIRRTAPGRRIGVIGTSLGGASVLLRPLLLMQLGPRLHISPSQLEAIRSISKLGAPVLVVAGSRDDRTTLAESQELFAAATEPKSLWVVAGARHQGFLRFGPSAYEEHVVSFLRQQLLVRARDGAKESFEYD